MDPFLGQLAELCRSNRTGMKWVIVPSHALGHTLGERLALEGTGWANLRFVTPFDLAIRMAGPSLMEGGVSPFLEGVGPALVMRLLVELPKETPAYFRHLSDQPKMADSLWNTIRELRLAGLRAEDLPRDAFSIAAKHAELRVLLAAYEEYLASEGLADSAAVYREAIEHPGLSPVLPNEVWTETPGVIWAPLERRLIDGLPGTHLPSEDLVVQGLEIPRRLKILGGHRRAIAPAPESDSERLAFLLFPVEAPPPGNDGTVSMFRAGGKEAEVEEILRRILASGVPLDQVEVAHATPDYAALLWEKAQRNGLPVTVGSGIPVSMTRPTRALLGFCSWIEGGFSVCGLRRLLQSGDILVDLDQGPAPGQAARLLGQSQATWGRRTYAQALTRLAAYYRERAGDGEVNEEERDRYRDRAENAERLKDWIDGILRLVPEPGPDGRVELDPLLDACTAFVERVAAKTNELDAAASALLLETFNEFRAIGHLSRPLDEALRLIRDRLENLRVGPDRSRPGHLHLTPLTQAGYAGRGISYVAGLEEGFLPLPLEDPVLLDEERRGIHPGLPTSGDRVSEALAAVLSRLAALGGRICLSFSCRDLRENRETFPSWLLLQVLRLQTPGRQFSYQDLKEDLREPVSTVPAVAEHALSDAGWWLANLRGAGTVARDAVEAAFPWLARGARAEAERESDSFTAFDGFVPAAGEVLDPRASGRAVSPTMLETLATCPFRHFLEMGLSIKPPEDVEPDPDRWLDPMARGRLLHEIYAGFWRELRENGERPEPDRHRPLIRRLADEKIEELRALIPPPSDRVFEHELRDLYQDFDLFLQLEAEQADRDPVGFEVSFGGGEPEGEPLAQADPISIDLGPEVRFLLRGRIDRIDRLPDGTYDAVDYKTGRFRPDDFSGRFQGGRLMQHALYALAARELLCGDDPAARVSAGSYYFPTRRGQGRRKTNPQGDGRDLTGLLRPLLEILAGGTFLHSPDEADCRWCEFRRACGQDPENRSKLKVGNPTNSVLDPYRRLKEIE